MKRTVLLHTPRFDVCMARVTQGVRPREHFYVDKPDAVLIIAYMAARVLLLDVKRLLVGGMSTELPGGRVEHGESPLAAAKRELWEECSLKSRRWTLLGTTYPLPSVTTEMVHVYAARVDFASVSPSPSATAAQEHVHKIRLCSLRTARRYALSGRMRCSADAYGLFLFLDWCADKEASSVRNR